MPVALALLLPACAPLDDCPIADTVATSRVVLDANQLDSPFCGHYPRFVTTEAGSLDFEDCVHLSEPDPLSCGYGFLMLCAVPSGSVLVDGYVELRSLRAGPVGLATLTWYDESGAVECMGEYEMDAWPEDGL